MGMRDEEYRFRLQRDKEDAVRVMRLLAGGEQEDAMRAVEALVDRLGASIDRDAHGAPDR